MPKFSGIALALCSGVPTDSDTGITLPEIASGITDGVNTSGTGYERYNLGDPAESGDIKWSYSTEDHAQGSGLIKNASTFLFNTALTDWGWVSGIAVVDSGTYGSGNMLMYAELNNPRIIYQGDTVKFDMNTLQIKFK